MTRTHHRQEADDANARRGVPHRDSSMFRAGGYEIRFASSPEDFEKIHQLNYRTFVREIPQHHDDGSGSLVDKFHHKNRYLIALKEDKLVGMLSFHEQPPFSVADRLPDPSILVQPNIRPLEIRLLAVEPEERNSPVLSYLVWQLYQHAKAVGITDLFISGVVEQQGLYRHLGFEPLGPPVGDGPQFVPMGVPLDRLEAVMSRGMQLLKRRLARTAERPAMESSVATQIKRTGRRKLQDAPICLLPGPVALSPEVQAAFREPILYHRADDFLPLYESVRQRLSHLVGGKPVALFVGSGTLGNDAVAATLAADSQRRNGLVLVTGEFGLRIRKQADRWDLAPKVLEWDWGQAWDLNTVEATLSQMPQGGWVWCVHHETSTGVLNDLPGLVALAKKYHQRVVVDCVSSLATVPIDLTDVWMATGASGKAIGSYAGIAFVFAEPKSLEQIDHSALPTYFDVHAALTTDGPRFTVPSPLINALHTALDVFSTPEKQSARFAQIAEVGGLVRSRLESAGFRMMAPAAIANPSIVTFAPPKGISAAEFVQLCRSWGYQIAGQSGYLAERNLVQIAVMGAVTASDVEPLLEKLEQ